MINKKIIAKELDIEIRTLYNWEKNRKKLYDFIIKNFKKDYEKIPKFDELKNYFELLSEKEQEYYLSKIKISVLEKEIKKINKKVLK